MAEEMIYVRKCCFNITFSIFISLFVGPTMTETLLFQIKVLPFYFKIHFIETWVAFPSLTFTGKSLSVS